MATNPARDLARDDPIERIAATVSGLICSFLQRPDGTYAMPYASPAILDLYGLRPEEVAEDASPILARIHPEDLDHVMASIAESARTLLQWQDRWRYAHPFKGERWIEGRSLPLRQTDCSILWHGFLWDVTESTNRERRIVELNAFLQLIMDAAPALISYIDAGLRYRKVNRAYERWFGHPGNEIEGRFVSEVLGEAAWARIAPIMRRALAGETQVFEAEIPYRDGGTRWVHASYIPDIDAAGAVRGMMVMVIDISEHRRIEEDLRRSRRQFAELLQRQDSIRDAERHHVAREVHDELGQLLTGMRMTLSALRMRGRAQKTGEAAGTLDELDRMLDQAAGVVRRVATSLHEAVAEHGLLPALEGLAADFRGMTGIVCQLTVSGELASIDGSQAAVLFRIAQESLTNIARHARAKSVSLQLSANMKRLRLSVQDDGCGFDVEAARKSGSGLGLFGMQERAEIAGGWLRITSAPGHGTQVEAELPLQAGEDG